MNEQWLPDSSQSMPEGSITISLIIVTSIQEKCMAEQY